MRHPANITIATNRVDIQGDRIKIAGVRHGERVRIYEEYDYGKPIGYLEYIFIDGNELKGKCHFNKPCEGYPGIVFKIENERTNDYGGVDYEGVELIAIGISKENNQDPSISKIKIE